MESAAAGPSRCTGAGMAALTAAASVGSCSGGRSGTFCKNPNFLPHFSDGPPPGFPSQASFGALKLFADAAFELQSQKGGACPLPHELIQLVHPPEPSLICLTALHAKNKTMYADDCCRAHTQQKCIYSRVTYFCAEAQERASCAPAECPPEEEQLNVAAADLAGCLLRLSQLSITRTPRGKHIILCRAFHILSRDCKKVALELQAQQRPEVIFPQWPDGTTFTPSLQQPQQSVHQQRPPGPPQQADVQEASQQRPQISHLAHQLQLTRGFQSQPQPQGEAASHTPQRGGFLNQNVAGVYPQHISQQQHLQQQQQLSHENRPPSGQQQRERPFSDQQEGPQQSHQAAYPTHLQRRPPQQPEQRQCLTEQQPQEQHLLRGKGAVLATGLQRQHSPQRYGSWQKEVIQQQRGVRDERSHHPDQQPPQGCEKSMEQHPAPNHKREQPQPQRQQQMHEGPRHAPVEQFEATSVPGSGPQRQPGVLSTYRSVPYQVSRPQGVQQQRAQHGVRTSVGGETFIPIEDLTAYVAKWTIRARVDVKGDIRKYNNARGPGQLFNVELKDKSGEIRATFFNAAVDRWYNVLQEGKVYYFRGGAVKAKNPRFNTTRHNYEITFDEKSSILETQDEGDIPTFSSDMVDIKKIDAMEEVNAAVSITAIVHDYRPLQSITIKATGQLKPKRDVFLVDENGLSICLTLWGEKAKELSEEQLSQRPLILFKNVKVGDWNGKKLDSQSSTRIELFPTNDRTAALQEWWTREGCAHPAFQTVSSGSGAAVGRKEVLKTLEQIGREAVQVDPSVIADKGVYFSCAALLERVSDERFSWPACPDCRKKMAETVAHIWSCANCGRHFEQPNHTYMLNIMLMDTSGSLRCTCMGDKAEELMGSVKAETLLLLQDHQSLDEQGRSFNDVFADVNLEEWIFRICSKSDTYMDEMRLKHRVVAAVPLFRRAGDQTRHRLSFIRNTFAQLDIPSYSFCEKVVVEASSEDLSLRVMADLENMRIGFIGAGVMAFALAKGFVESGRVSKEKILMLVRNDVKRSLVEDLGYMAVCEPRDVALADIIFLSVKPQDAIALLKEINILIHEKKHLLISICAGVDLNTLIAALNHNRAVVEEDRAANRRVCRVMPNTPCQIRKGVSLFSVGAGCTTTDVEILHALLSAVGTCYKIEEKQMAAGSAISGSGPAFVFTLLDALSDAGVKNGLPRKLAQDLAMDMVAGSANLARAEFGRRHFAELKDQVTSPGGTTIAGIAALERWGFRNAILQAIDATTDRSKDLGG